MALGRREMVPSTFPPTGSRTTILIMSGGNHPRPPMKPRGAPPEDVTVAVLGPLLVTRAGEVIPFGGPKARLVLARLAVAAPHLVSSDAVIDAVWGERPPMTARKVLQKHISELRRALGSATVRTDGDGYTLALPSGQIDLQAFQEILDRARAARATGSPRRAWELYEEALGLWRGPAFAGLLDAPFAADESARLEELRVAATEEQIESGLLLGKDAALVAPLQNLVRRHPLRERMWALLMTALYRTGRQAEALDAYQRARRVLVDELGVDPSPELSQLEEKILTHDPSLAAADVAMDVGNLPVGYTSFVGRDRELAQLTSTMGTARLVTVTGPGGSGKTRLAIEFGSAARSGFRDGVWFVDLAPLDDPARVLPAIASVLGIAPEPGVALDRTVVEFLATKTALVVLDNCEQVAAQAAAVAHEILEATISVRVLATSREPLGLAGEAVLPLSPLDIPAPEDEAPDALARVDAVRLFVDRATAADAQFRLDKDSAQAVAEICRKLEGLPLAIELAARQLHVIGPRELRRGLLNHLDLLMAPGQPEARHRTMQAAIEWSYRLLEGAQRDLFLAVSVFPGSFPESGAARVCAEAGIDIGSSAMPPLAALVGRSMVVRSRSDDTPRYRLLEPIRGFARAQARAEGLDERFARAHALWVRDLLREEPDLLGPQEREHLERLAADQHQVAAAFTWAVENDRPLTLEMLANASGFFMEGFRMISDDEFATSIAADDTLPLELRAMALANGAVAMSESFSDYRSAQRWSELALNMAHRLRDERLIAMAEAALAETLRSTGDVDTARLHIGHAIDRFDILNDRGWSARARNWLAQIELARGRYDEVIDAGREAIARWDEIGSDWGASKAWRLMAAAHAGQGRHDAAERYAGRALELMQGFPDPSPQVHVRAVQGDAARLAGHPERAEAIYRDCLSGFRAIGDRRCTASTLKNLGAVTLHLGRIDEAERLLLAALRRRRRLGDEAGVPECLEGLALAADHTGDYEPAVVLLAAAHRLRADAGVVAPEVERTEIAATLKRLRASLAPDLFERAWQAGRERSADRIVAEAERLVASPADT